MLSQSGNLVGTSVLSQSGADNKLNCTIPCAGEGAALQISCRMRKGTALAWLGATQQSELNWLVDQCRGVSRWREAVE